MSKILFGQSYFLRFDPKLWEAMQPYPPLGTLYAASVMRAEGYEVALFDAMLAQSVAEWGAALEREQPRYAILYEDNFNYLSKMCLLRMREAAFEMIQMARAQGCRVIVGGSDATDQAEAYLAQGADFVLLGEGEETLRALMARLEGRDATPLAAIEGLAFCDEQTGAPHRTPRRRDIRMLDALPFPAWDLVDVERYRTLWRERHGYYSMNMVTTRGCPYHCNWCAKPIWGQRYAMRSPENVVAEMRWLHDAFGPDHIWFADDIAGLKPGWWPRFADLMEEAGLRLPFKCLSRADLLLRQDDIPALKRAGCDIVWIGAESGSQRVLDAMEKGTRVEQIHEAARRLHAAGVRVGFFLQFGYPGESREEIEQTLKMVWACQPDDIGMSVSYPLPGTPFHERVQGQLGAQQNWQDSSDLAMLYQGPFSTQFYRRLHTRLHKEYRARQAGQRLRGALRHPGSLRGAHARDMAAMLYHWTTLPLAKWRMARCQQPPARPLSPLAPALDPDAAATPSPQRSSSP